MKANSGNNSIELNNSDLEIENQKQKRSNSLVRRIYNELKQMSQKGNDSKLFSFLTGPEGAGSYGGVYIVPQYTFVRQNSAIKDNCIVLENSHQHHRHEIKV